MKFKHVFFLFLLLPVLMMFQNCSDPDLVLDLASEDPPTQQSVGLEVNLCSEVSFLDDEENNFLFIFDMSRSNIGSFKEGTYQGYSGFYYWDPSTGTDPNGDRFEALKNFVTSCARSENNKFAVVGFSENAGSILYDQRGRPYLSCEEPIPFKSSEDIIQEIETLKEAEQNERLYHEQWITTPYDESPSAASTALAYTSYTQGAECASRVVLDDFVKSFENQVDNYHILFLSDGVPADSEEVENSCANVPANQKVNCYTRGLVHPIEELYSDLSALRVELNLYSVAYGTDDAEATRYLDAFSSIVTPDEALKLDNFSQNTNFLCQMIATRIGLEIQSDNLLAVPLTMGQRAGVYLSDSDVDGLFDVDEVALGYRPDSSRSQVDGVLDGVCEFVGGIGSCNRLKAQTSCDDSLLFNSGLSDCDIEVLKAFRSDLNLGENPDWDSDGVSNFIEIIKNTNPFLNDMSYDPDNDGLTTLYEIVRGKNPYEHEDLGGKDLPSLEFKNETSAANNICPLNSVTMSIDKIPFVESLKFENEDGLVTFTHGKNEHVIAIFSNRKAQNYVATDKGILGRFLNLKRGEDLNGETDYLSPEENSLTNGDMLEWTR